MKKHSTTSNHPLFVRVICWILILLMVAGAIYYTIMGLQALFASFAKDAPKTASLPSALPEALLLQAASLTPLRL